MLSDIFSKNSIFLMVQGSSPTDSQNGELSCKIISEFFKDVVKDEAPKACLLSHRYYTQDLYSSFDTGNKSPYNPEITEITKDDIFNEQKKDVRTGYRFAYTDSLVNFGRIDEDFDVVMPINQSASLKKMSDILTKNLGVGQTNDNFRLTEKLEGLLLSNLTLAPSV